MKTIGIIADTHGWLPASITAAFNGVDMILHAGDVSGDEPATDVIGSLRTLAPVVLVVGGNGDPADQYPSEVEFTCEGVTIHLSHGHEVDPKGWWLTPERLVRRYSTDVIVFGHTHRKVVTTVGTTLVVNPGSVARHHKRPAVLRLELPSRRVEVVNL